MKKQSIDPAILPKILRYDDKSGQLFWLPRTPDLFRSNLRSADHCCAIWNARYAGKKAFNFQNALGYWYGRLFDIGVAAHHAVFAIHHGRWPTEIDHINRNPSDNRIENLRETSRAENLLNTASRGGSSKFKGVSWCKRDKTWMAYIKVNRKMKNLGLFKNEEDAARARDAAIFAIAPEHCVLNFPLD